jgi:hypothetical protein
MMPGSGGDVNTTLPLILSIASVLLCGNYLLGIPAIILAVMAGSSKTAGNLEDARSKAKVSTILCVVGFALNMVIGLGVGLLIMLGLIGASTNH